MKFEIKYQKDSLGNLLEVAGWLVFFIVGFGSHLPTALGGIAGGLALMVAGVILENRSK